MSDDFYIQASICYTSIYYKTFLLFYLHLFQISSIEVKIMLVFEYFRDRL